MVDAGRGDRCALFRLGQYEGRLQDDLNVKGETLGGPIRADTALSHGLGDVGLDPCRVLAMLASHASRIGPMAPIYYAYCYAST